MLDMNLIRSNPELVKENIRKKFQDEKLPLVDDIIALDKEYRQIKTLDDELRGICNDLETGKTQLIDTIESGKLKDEKHTEILCAF